MIPTFRLVAFNLSVLACASPLAADLKFTPLGKLTDGTFAYVRGFSADGTTVVGYGQTTGDAQLAFRGTLTGLVSLGDLPGGPATPDSKANAVSSDGSVVVGFGTVAGLPIPTGGSTALTQEAFRWTSAGGLVSLGRLPGSIYGSEAFGVSADGSVVVGRAYNASSFPEPFRWTSGGGLVSLGFMSGGNQGQATGVSADGSVVVGYGNTTGSSIAAFRWTEAGGMAYLGDLPGGSVRSLANAVSADGTTVVGYGRTDDGQIAMRWTQAGGMVSLGYLPSNFIQSEALAVSSDGSVIVGTSSTSTGPRAFVWDAANGMRNIQDLLNAAGKASGWTISHATGISANGKIVAGYGTTASGHTEAWILDLDAPPPPAPTAGLVWTEDRPQTQPLKGNSAIRIGYDNGVAIGDIATLTEASNGTWGGIEYANGLLLVPSAATNGTGTRYHDPRYSPILVTNINSYDLDATTGFLWQANGGGQQIIKGNTSSTLSGTGVHDRTYGTAASQLGFSQSIGQFTNALQVVDSLVYFSSSIGSSIGLHIFNPADSSVTPVFTESSPVIYDFEIVGDQIYFADITNNAIRRVKTDGTGVTALVSGALFPNSIEVTENAIYWTELNTKLIRRSNLDGSGVTTLYELTNTPRGVAVVPLSLLSGPAPQALSIGGLANIPPFRYTGAINTPVPLTPASTSGLPVTLEIVSGPATLSGNSITYTGTGAVVVRATQAGDASFAPTTFTTSINAVPRLAQTITFPQPANVTYSGAPVVVTPTATASSGLLVNYSLISGPATYDSVNKTFTVTSTGSITIRATQTGDTTYAPAPFVERTFTSSAPGADTLADFLTAAGVPANLRGPNDDADNDKLDNLLEYALDLNPNGTGGAFTGTPPLLSSTPTLLQLTYRRVRNDVTYTVETSPTLIGGTWTSVGVTQGTPAGDGTTTASIPVGAGYSFLRLVVRR